MDHRPDLSHLGAFALQRIAAERYPDADHIFVPATCPRCGIAPFVLRVEHHTGSQPGRFHSVVDAHCPQCGDEVTILSFTGPHRSPERVEHPVCRCGSAPLYVATCERDESIPGFFDEGVIVACCAHCGQLQVVVHTD